MDKHKLLKKVLIIILIVAAGVFLADWAMGKYKFWQETKKVDKLAQALRDIEKKDYEMAMADTFGGQTPAETLQMFINAVEQGDYELASKYFIIPKQTDELESLKSAPKENIENVLGLLRQINMEEGSYNTNGDNYLVRKPILVEFLLYPNGVWKIVEI
ncbi:MAG: hypothetical protein UU96_C0028G0002 [Parcubacteria group bacterium GW2011_GWC2_42_13]|nr:MAG: hypothetical protein UU96_C0028G0002 [Parcubacteria group bacterium GW2011_GWC2_42_13]